MASRVDVTLGSLARSRQDLDDAGAVSARAFQFDPFFEFLSPRPMLRARARGLGLGLGLGLSYRSILATIGDRGLITGARDASGRLVGVAAWVMPGCYPLSVGAQLRQLAGAFRALVPRPPALVSGSKYLLALDKVHPHDPVWYLWVLVVDPSVQRSGIGGLLQAPQLEDADTNGLDCCLETQNADNLPYYRRFVYEVEHELHPVRGGPPLWTMRRPAAR